MLKNERCFLIKAQTKAMISHSAADPILHQHTCATSAEWHCYHIARDRMNWISNLFLCFSASSWKYTNCFMHLNNWQQLLIRLSVHMFIWRKP